VNYPVLLGKESTAHAYGDVQFLPDTFYIGRDGKIVSHVQGLINRKEIEEQVKKALTSSAASIRNRGLRPAETGVL
jgi:glutathione peroxidase-family protein